MLAAGTGNAGATDDWAEPVNEGSLEGSPFIAVPFLAATLRCRWRLWVGTGLAALLAAVAFSLALPPPYSASTVLLLGHPDLADPSRAIATDTQLANTRTVAEGAFDRLNPDQGAQGQLSSYRVAPLSGDILQITVDGPGADEAVRRADALAGAFLDFRRDEFERRLQAEVGALEERADALAGELGTVTDTINAMPSGEGQPNDPAVREYADQLARRAALSTEIATIRQRIDESTLETKSLLAKSRVVDPPTADGRSPVKALAVNMAAGIVLGLGLGVGWVVVQAVASDRVRRREDVMDAFGAPVALSVGAFRGPLWVQRRRLRRGLASPADDMARIVAHLRRALPIGRTGEPTLVVVSVDGDVPAGLAVASTAMELSAEGRSVFVADLSRASILARLFQVPARGTSMLQDRQGKGVLSVSFPALDQGSIRDHGQAEGEFERLRTEADVILVLATVDPAVGAWHLNHWAPPATPTVAVTVAGRSTATAQRSASQMLRAAGLTIGSVVLVGADRNDESVGMGDLARPSP